MTVSPTVEQRTTLHAVPRAETSAAPKLHQQHQRQIVRVEDDLFGASTELVYQRDDLAEAASDENNRALVRAIRAIDDGDYVLARDLIRVALLVEQTEDAAVERAKARRENAHGHQKNATARVDSLLTGRELELPYPLDGVMAPAICGAEREPMGAIRFERCDQASGHERDGGVHCFVAIGPEGSQQP